MGRSQRRAHDYQRKMLFRVISRRDQLSKNWQYWGAKGVFDTCHVEFGVASTITPLRFANSLPDGNLIVRARRGGFETVMREFVWKVFDLNMFNGILQIWLEPAIWRVPRRQLVPIIKLQAVILAWLLACGEGCSQAGSTVRSAYHCRAVWRPDNLPGDSHKTHPWATGYAVHSLTYLAIWWYEGARCLRRLGWQLKP